MFEYCKEELDEALTNVTQLRERYQKQTWFKKFVDTGCTERWTQAGVVQPEMVAYCYTQEFQAFDELRFQSGQASYNSGGAEACFAVWKSKTGSVFLKTAECYRKHAETPNFKLPTLLRALFDDAPAQSPAATKVQATSLKP